MGFFRSLYREIRDIAGLKPPAENEAQRAERIAGELKADHGGKRSKEGDDYVVTTTFADRPTRITCEVEGSRAILSVTTSVKAPVALDVLCDLKGQETEPAQGAERVYVASALYIEGTARDVARAQQLWKELPTGARGTASQMLTATGGAISLAKGVLTFAPDKATLADKSARHTIKSQLTAFQKVIEGVEATWG